MSYPLRRTVHAAHTVSLRYGRTTLRLPAPPHAPFFATLWIRKNTQRNPDGRSVVALGMVGSAPQFPPSVTVPHPLLCPRRPLDASDRLRGWYENDLGWPVVPGSPLRLLVGPCFDVLDVPAAAGIAALRHLAPASPVAAQGGRGCGC
ncbi:hypothetical protein SGLAM104S_00713 [Streptomyces glaucescens]